MRTLASIRKIDSIQPIEGADAIEKARIGGWWVVIAKKDNYKVGDLVVYCEVDSWIPHDLAPFLSKGQEPREYEGIKGERLRTVKLRGQVSQGLILKPSVEFLADRLCQEGQDVSDLLGIIKYEPPVPAQLAGQVRGMFPTIVPKTDQERIQNLSRELEEWKQAGLTFEVTEKLDGSSCTWYLDNDGDFHVCSRNLDLKEDYNNSFWKVAREYDVAAKMDAAGYRGYAIQGELIGEGVQGNRYNIKGQDVRVFDVYNVNEGRYLTSQERVNVVSLLGLKHCPVTQSFWKLNVTDTVDSILKIAESTSVLNESKQREGLVFKNVDDPSVTFKAISNKFLFETGG